jgi:hypothetical protein
MSVLQSGQVAVGTASPGAQLGVVGSSNAYPAIYAQGGAAASGSGQDGSDGIEAYGNSGDLSSSSASGGAGGTFTGGTSSNPYTVGDGIIANAGGPTGQFGAVAGFFGGDIFVNGNVYNSVASLKMDHPLDPANKYLLHSSVESSEMKNMYDGVVVTDANGDAIVPLPEWFEALNRDFRYQLTVIGQFAQAIVTGEVANHQFSIKTDKPGVKVSWQVTGIRQDAWANAHRTPVEAEKNDRERGHYLHPELYGAPEEASIEWARHPETMKRIKEMREQQGSPHAATAPKSGPAAPITR